MKAIERPTVVRYANAAKMSVAAVLESPSEAPAHNVSDASTHAAAEMCATDTGTDMRSAQTAAEVGPTNAAAQVSTPDASSKVASPEVTSAKVTSPTVTASATACKGVGCQCGASQRHGEDGNRDPLHNRALHDCYLSVPDRLRAIASQVVTPEVERCHQDAFMCNRKRRFWSRASCSDFKHTSRSCWIVPPLVRSATVPAPASQVLWISTRGTGGGVDEQLRREGNCNKREGHILISCSSALGARASR